MAHGNPSRAVWTAAAIVGVLALATGAQATLIAEDQFVIGSGDYTANASIVNQSSASSSGFTGKWLEGGTGIVHPKSENLSFGSGGAYFAGLATGGGSAQIDVSPYNDVFRMVHRALSGYTTAGTYYLSGLLSAPSDSNGEALMGFIGSTSSVRWGIVDNKATVRLGEALNGNSKPTGGSDFAPPAASFVPDQTNLFVAKVEVNDSGNDTVSLWFNPKQYTSEGAAGIPDLVVDSEDLWNDSTPPEQLMLSTELLGGYGSATKVIKFDEARFATAWEDAVPIDSPGREHIGFQEDVLPTAVYTHLGGELREFSSVSGADTNIRCGGHSGSGIGKMRTVLHFDLSDITPGTPIEEVALRLTVDSGSGSSLGLIELHQVLPGDQGETMLEGQTTWGNRNSTDAWTAAGGDYDLTVLASISIDGSVNGHAGETFTLESSVEFVAAVQGAINAGAALELILIAPNAEALGYPGTGTNFVRWRSDDWNPGTTGPDWLMGTRPLLSISIFPEPTSLSLLALGGLGLLARRRRK